jgi:hypothetical protein
MTDWAIGKSSSEVSGASTADQLRAKAVKLLGSKVTQRVSQQRIGEHVSTSGISTPILHLFVCSPSTTWFNHNQEGVYGATGDSSQ